MDAQGTVVSLEGADVLVRMDETGCGRCYEPGGCGGNNLNQIFCRTPRHFRALNAGELKPGDRVTVLVDAGAVWRSASLMYGVPLLAALGGALSGTALQGEMGAISGLVLGLVSAYGLMRRLSAAASLRALPRALPLLEK